MKKILFSLLVLGLIGVAPVEAQMLKEQQKQPNLPRWSSDVTAQQKAVLQELIDGMVMVEGGTFIMGATTEQGSDAELDEKPNHQVILSDYMIGKTEVTQEQWEAVMGSNPSSCKGTNLPVEQVSWNDCQEFIKKLNSLTGLNFRLPTEAEWEYAARGGAKSLGYKYSGSNDIDSVAWYDNNSSEIQAVATKQANELGLYDMSGNVWEWCSDWFGGYSSSPQTNPNGPSSGVNRVTRGGSWDYNVVLCRVSFRNYSRPNYSFYNLGMRLSMSFDESQDPSRVNPSVNVDMPCHGSEIDVKQNAVLQQLIDGMVKVEGGAFTMGATFEQGRDALVQEKPTHIVTLSDYMIGKTEVTQEQWEAVMGSNPSYFKGSNLPVESVSWNDCQEFIKKLKSLTGLNFRLPTEAEWEYAARGGAKSRGYKYSGSNDINAVAWYANTTNDSGTMPVATKQANELGLYDMSGNVREWCSDWFGDYTSLHQTNPKGPSSGSNCVSRGGSWDYNAGYCRVSNRGNRHPSNRDDSFGLRLVLSIAE